MSQAIKPKSIRSVWLEGIDKSKSIPDQFGKTLDQIGSQIHSQELGKLDKVFSDFSAGAKKSLFDLKGKISGVKDLADKVKGTIESLRPIAARVQDAVGIYKEFKDKNFDAILNRFTGVAPDGIIDLAKYGMEAHRLIKATDWHDWQSILQLASDLTGENIPDLLGITQLQSELQALLQMAQQYDIPDAIEMIKKKLNGGDPELTRDMYRGMGMNARLGQFETFVQMLDMMDASAVKMMHPTIIEDILGSYRFPVDYKESEFDSYREKIINTLNKIDPMWDHELEGEIKLFKTGPWQRCSEDVKKLFQFHDDYGVLTQLSQQYAPIPLKDALNRTYPRLNLQ